jgi:CPA1 family monovalent cation:H+ antiporter
MYPCCAVIRWSSPRVTGEPSAHFLFWGGLGGALALALALALPDTVPERDLGHRDQPRGPSVFDLPSKG